MTSLILGLSCLSLPLSLSLSVSLSLALSPLPYLHSPTFPLAVRQYCLQFWGQLWQVSIINCHDPAGHGFQSQPIHASEVTSLIWPRTCTRKISTPRHMSAICPLAPSVLGPTLCFWDRFCHQRILRLLAWRFVLNHRAHLLALCLGPRPEDTPT